MSQPQKAPVGWPGTVGGDAMHPGQHGHEDRREMGRGRRTAGGGRRASVAPRERKGRGNAKGREGERRGVTAQGAG